MILSILSFSSLVALASASLSFTANINAGGATGYYKMNIAHGQGVYNYNIDFSNFVTSCNITDGISYHVHSFWTDIAYSSTTTCGDAGGHYDPYLACGASSQNHGDLCAALSRTSDLGYSYACDKTDYANGHLAICEVGDLSGKFGKLYPDENGMVKGDITDPVPPISANYESEDAVSLGWSSIVFHCPADNSRILCAHFLRDKC